MKVLHTLYALNRGLVSRLALARLDLKRLALSAETYLNWIPRVMGSMMLRPGLGYVTSTRSDAAAIYIPFVYATDETALVELTASNMRVLVSDVVIARPAVTSTFTRWNGAAYAAAADTGSSFVDATDVSYWRDSDESGGASALATGGYLSLLGNGLAAAIRDRVVTVAGGNIGVEHQLSIRVFRGKVTLRLGSTEGGDEYLTDRTLRAGYHSIALTPSGDFYIRLSNAADVAALVDYVNIGQSAADMTVTTPWAADNLASVRWEQSGDVIFVACDGIQPQRIERQGADSSRSWSVVEYAPEDGPFMDLNTGPVQLKGSALTGDITLTASKAFFKTTNVGSLYKLVSAGQQVSKRIQAQNTFSDPIRVTGIDAGRVFTITLSGPTFTGTTTVTLQRSITEPGDWTDVTSYTAAGTTTYDDTLDNQIVYYRIGVKTGNYTAADDLTAALSYPAGSITGIVRATVYLTNATMSAQVLTDLGELDTYTSDWYEGAWSSRRGWPSAVALFEGRLFWAGKDKVWGSVSDAYDSFDSELEGDSGPIIRSLGSGPVDTVNWLAPVNHLLIGLQGGATVAKSSSFDEPLTPTKFSLKPVSDSGSAAIRSVKVDTAAIYVSRNGSRVTELSYDGAAYSYVPGDLTAVVPDIGSPGFSRIAVQRHPDTRIHFVRTDGTVAILLFDKLENVTCWTEFETDGTVEDVVVLPGAPASPTEDQVYYVVNRTINGSTKRYLEKWAQESKGQGAADTRLADSHVTGTLSASTAVPVAHLEAETVCLWGNTKYLGTYTVASGAITASEAITGAYTVGLPYTADWKSAKLGVASEAQSPLTQRKRIAHVGLVLADTHAQGLKVGQDFDHLDDMPMVEAGADVDQDAIHTAYDYGGRALNGKWDNDARLCLRAQAPKPCTVLAVVLGVTGHDHV